MSYFPSFSVSYLIFSRSIFLASSQANFSMLTSTQEESIGKIKINIFSWFIDTFFRKKSKPEYHIWWLIFPIVPVKTVKIKYDVQMFFRSLPKGARLFRWMAQPSVISKYWWSFVYKTKISYPPKCSFGNSIGCCGAW